MGRAGGRRSGGGNEVVADGVAAGIGLFTLIWRRKRTCELERIGLAVENGRTNDRTGDVYAYVKKGSGSARTLGIAQLCNNILVRRVCVCVSNSSW